MQGEAIKNIFSILRSWDRASF